MEFLDFRVRKQALITLRESVDSVTTDLSSRLRTSLTEEENFLYDETERLEFNEGSWYRPHHNFIVTAAMANFCAFEDLDPKILMPAAILHDIGYSRVEIDFRNADWQGKDKRVAHMDFGAVMTHEILTRLTKESKVEFTGEQIASIVDIVANHDNCYIGKPYTSDDQLNHLDADRIYVMAFSSFYKDLFNYLDKEAVEGGDDFLRNRVAFFYSNSDDNPIEYTHPFDPERQKQNEGGHRVPLRLETARSISDAQFLHRSEELRNGILELNLKEFGEYCGERLEKEATYLLGPLTP